MGWRNKIEGKWAIVTGGAGGIGLEFAKVLRDAKADILLIDKDKERLEETRKALVRENKNKKGKLETLALDLTDVLAPEKIESFCLERNIKPLILINNAGIFSFAPITETNTRKLDLFIDLHVRAVTTLSKWFCNLTEHEGEGMLLNMSSMSCWMPMPGLAMYSATKSYIRVFSRALHYEMKDSGVKVMVACPGGIATDLFGLPEKWRKFAVRIGVLDTPSGFAAKAVKRLAQGKKQYINGWLNRFSIFFVGVMPTGVRMMVKHKLLDKGIKR